MRTPETNWSDVGLCVRKLEGRRPLRPKTRRTQASASAKSGFTLLEILVVAMIIGILVALLMPAITTLRNSAKRRHAKAKAIAFVNAVTEYRTVYGKYPGQTQDDVDQFIEPELMLEAIVNNARGIIFMDFSSDDFLRDPSGVVVDLADPWGYPYVIAIDENDDGVTDMDEDITGSFGTGTIVTNVADVAICVVSWGGNPASTNARVYSWR